jgi:hypothetical protein
MRSTKALLIIFVCLFWIVQPGAAQTKTSRPRTIVTSDGEVDDIDSYIRLLLYANELNIVGMVYSSSEFHYAGDGKGTTFTSNMPFAKQYETRTTLRWLGTGWMQGYIDKYAAVYDNLIKHDKNYPTPQYLKSIVKMDNIDFESEMDHDTEGSDFIKKMLLDNNPVPLYIQVWGGTNTIARALKSIEDEYKSTPQWKTIYKKVCDKTTLYIILDQDETYKKYVAANWPDIKVILNSNQFWCFAYAWTRLVPEIRSYLDGNWYAEHIKFNHGPLVGSYFLWGDGQKLVNDPDHTQGDTAEVRKAGRTQYDFISEGDSPSYLFLINTGLRNLEDPSYGGWGGRFVQSATKPRLWLDGMNITDYNFYDKKEDFSFMQSRWITANHAPVVNLKQPDIVSVKPGQTVPLSGIAIDPDGDSVTYHWWQYEEAGTYKGKVEIQNSDRPNASFVVPKDATAGRTLHIIMQVTDNGTPALTRHQRVIVRLVK